MPTPPLVAVDGDRFPEPIVAAWNRAGLDEPVTWADGEQYRLRVPATEPENGITALATVLDLTAVEPETLFVHLELGRQASFGPKRRSVGSLAGHADVLVTDTHTAGAVPIDAFETLVGLGDVIEYTLIRDSEACAIAEWRGEYLRFVLPSAAVDSLRVELDVGEIELLGDRGGTT